MFIVRRIATEKAGLIAKQKKLDELKKLNLQQKEMELRQLKMEQRKNK